ncbi:hypothetical protein Clacol_001335 [Clathrus columnatus]|uniref:Aminoglycoside phosphotransferase domain-containing protein n=1 Tax=Clathrus columnatus TaxID=1419009 RepID=A0AAV5A5F9_9AGAM|nr:hypothetical protein Clacol_001335 [Clathrus columnatus]
MRDSFQMVARIPCPVTTPKYFAVAGEVATMDLLRSFGLPIPEIYGYSPVQDNAAETEYIFMEFVKGICLSDLWFDLTEEDITSISRQLTELESKMMSITFPAGGNLYYTKDLEKVARSPGVPLEDERFCVGPDTRLSLWYGRRSQLDVDRGPYSSPEAALLKGAEKELAYLKQFGRPLLPFQRQRRESYQYRNQSPSNHMQNLDRYLLIASSLIPKDPALSQFRIRHPDPRLSNIFVSRSPDSSLHIVSLIDWQHTSILPMFLLAGTPERFQNYDDPITQSMTRPFAARRFGRPKRSSAKQREGTLPSPSNEELGDAYGRGDTPCPIVFDAEDIRQTMKLDEEPRGADEILEKCQNFIGVGPQGWVPVERYEEAMRRSKQLKEDTLAAAESEKERAEIAAHWPLDDMNKEEYM